MQTRFWGCVLGMLALAAAALPAAAEPLQIRMSWIITPGELAPILFAHPGLAKHDGTSYVIEPIHFAGGPLSIPTNHAEAVKIVADFNKQPLASAGWAFTRQDQFRSPDVLPDVDALQRNVDLLWKLGFLKAKIDVAAHSDLSLVREADARMHEPHNPR